MNGKILKVVETVWKYRVPIIIATFIILSILGVHVATTIADEGSPPNPQPI